MEVTRPIIGQIARVLERSLRSGAIRPDIDPIELHMA